LGIGFGEDKILPTRVNIRDKIAQVECGYAHTVAITENCEVYTFGADGITRNIITCSTMPTKLHSLERNKIIQTAAGKTFTLYLSSDGVVFASGENDFGQLGVGDRIRRYKPVIVEHLLPHFITEVRAFGRNAMAITNTGIALQWGEGVVIPIVRVSNVGPSVDGAVGNGVIVVKARLADAFSRQIERCWESIFAEPGPLGRALLTMLSDPLLLSYADVNIVADKKIFRAHSYILEKRHVKVPRDKVLYLDNFSNKSVSALLRLIYSGTLPAEITICEARELLMLAQQTYFGDMRYTAFAILKNALSSEVRLERQIAVDSDGVCPICLEDMSDGEVRILQCRHGFHKMCVDEWLERRTQCPMCKEYVLPDGFTEPSGHSPLDTFGILESSLGNDIHRCLGDNGDVVVTLANGDYSTVSIGAHRAILASRSSYFRRVIEKAPDAKELVVHRISQRFLNCIIRFMYLGVDAVTCNLGEWTRELLALAYTYGMPDLQFVCEQKLIEGIDREQDIGALLKLSSQVHARRLRMGCLSVLQKRVKTLHDSIEAIKSLHGERLSLGACIFRKNKETQKEMLRDLEAVQNCLTCDLLQVSDAEALHIIRVIDSHRLSRLLSGVQETPRRFSLSLSR